MITVSEATVQCRPALAPVMSNIDKLWKKFGGGGGVLGAGGLLCTLQVLRKL